MSREYLCALVLSEVEVLATRLYACEGQDAGEGQAQDAAVGTCTVDVSKL